MKLPFRRTAPFILFLLFAPQSASAQAAGQTASLGAAVPAVPNTAARALPKRTVLLRVTTTPPAETRVTVSADAPLDDYAVRREGARLTVELPWSSVRASQLSAEGQAFTGASAAQDGDAVRLVFDLRPGASVRLAGGFNRVDIIFTAARNTNDAAQGPVGTTAAPRAQGGAAATPNDAAAGGAGEAEELRQMRAQIAALEARVKELEEKRQAAQQNAAAPAAATGANAEARDAVAASDTSAAAPAAQSGAHQHDDDNHQGAPTLQFQGFADVDLHASSEKGSHTSFALGQLDLFMTSRLSDKFNVLGELIIEANQQNNFTIQVHRLLLQYTPNDYFHVAAGRYHTSIGYYNTAYHHGLWFQTAATRPFIFAFESQGGILPLHNVGLTATGRVPGAPFGLHYVAEVGNGRASRSTLDAAVQTAVDENNRKAYNLGLFVRPASLQGFQAGFSVYRDRLTPAGLAPIPQTIDAGYVVFHNARYESLNEVIVMRLTSGGRVFNTTGFYTQFARQFGNARPFFRYEYVNVPRDNPLFSDVGRRNGPSVGVRYDLTDFAAFKAQLQRTSRRSLSSINEMFLQLAFTF
jgi:hypothetical protein